MGKMSKLPLIPAILLLSSCSTALQSDESTSGRDAMEPAAIGSSASSSAGSSESSSSARSEVTTEAVSSGESEDTNVKTIRSFYGFIENQELRKAYDLYSVKKIEFATFEGWYRGVKDVEIREVKENGPSIYAITVVLTDKSGQTSTYEVMMRSKDGKIETRSSKLIPDPNACGGESEDGKYNNPQLGICFYYEDSWPEPVLSGPGSHDGGIPHELSQWRLYIGPVCRGCAEGTDTYTFYLDSYPSTLDIESKLRADELVDVRSETIHSDVRTIVYGQGGICGNLHALLLREGKTTFLLTGKCADDSPKDKEKFMYVLNNLHLTK
jgi:hypothetical protein